MFDLTKHILTFIIIQSGFSLIQHISCQFIHISDNISEQLKAEYILYIWNYSIISCLWKNSQASYNICSVVTRINTECESFIMNYSLGKINKTFLERVQGNRPCNWDVQIMRTVHTRFEFNDFWITYHTVQRSTRVVDLRFSNPSFKRHVTAIMLDSIIMNYKLEINVINALMHHITVE